MKATRNNKKNQKTTKKQKLKNNPVFKRYKNKPKLAIKHLMKIKKGEALEALYREDIGYVDIIWGDEKHGLCHIIKKHKNEIKQLGFEVEDFIPIIFQYGEFNKKKSKDSKIVLDSQMFRIIISTHYFGEERKWLLSAFDLRKKARKK